MRSSGPPTRGGRKVKIVSRIHGGSGGWAKLKDSNDVTIRRGGIIAFEITWFTVEDENVPGFTACRSGVLEVLDPEAALLTLSGKHGSRFTKVCHLELEAKAAVGT